MTSKSFVFSVSGVTVSVDLLAFASLAFVVIEGGIGLLLIALPSFLIHELCHIVAAGLFECRLCEIHILPLGGTLYFDVVSDKKLSEEIAVYLFAPLANILLYSVFYAIGIRASDIVLLEISMVNGIIALASLIPCPPLDGGNILKAILNSRLDSKRASNIIFAVCCVFSSILIICFVFYLFSGSLYWQIASLGALIFVCGLESKKYSQSNAFSSIIGKDRILEKNGMLKQNSLCISCDITLAKALRFAKCGQLNMYCVIDGDMNVIGILSENEILSAAVDYGSEVTVRSIINQKKYIIPND